MTRLFGLFGMVAVILAVSARVYQEHQVLGLLIFAIGMLLFVLPPYYRLMGITRDDDEKG
ncbi:hypothetical protein ABZ912_29890 [Nonomuraea angiospora]|uniref:hypothetical protein n=1 Tax=Nonomuraea angiospora TaxID=46172 RepID=UPI0033D03C78